MQRLFSPILLLVLSLAFAQAAAPLTVRIHSEATEHEGSQFVTQIELNNSKKKTYIRKVPVVTEREILAFYPLQMPDGSLGAYLLLDADGRNKLEQHTGSSRDTMVVALINGRVANSMRVDKKVTDGILYIPGGFLPEELVQLQAKYPTLGKEKEFDEQKKKANELLKQKAKQEKAAAKEKAAAEKAAKKKS